MAHTFTNLWFHVIFGTKGRAPSIDSDVRAPLHAYIGGIVRELKGTAMCVNGVADHVHTLIKLPPTIAIADAMRIVKTNSSTLACPRLTPWATLSRRSAAFFRTLTHSYEITYDRNNSHENHHCQ